MDTHHYDSLVQRAQQGDKEALGALWESITPKLFGYLVNTLRNKATAEDVLQTTWVKAIVALPKFHARGVSIEAWVFAIARNECRMLWRVKGREIPYDADVHDVSDGSENNSENSILVEQLFTKMRDADREILRLYYIGGLEVEEVAHVLGTSAIATRVRMYRALRRAKKILTHHTYE
jgi:RNA polymerase sigma-70 factor (ECF subfamily)